jgi:hypothetical protein
VFCTCSRPQGEKLMVQIRERPTAADGDEARVAVFGEDHGFTCSVASAKRCSNNTFLYRVSNRVGEVCLSHREHGAH